MDLTAFDGKAFLLLIVLALILWAAFVSYREHRRWKDVCVRCGHRVRPGRAFHPLCLHLERAEQNNHR